MKSTKYTTLIHSIIVIIIGLVITITYFAPMVFDGKKLPQHDIKQGNASQKELIDYRNKTGEEALWTDRMFGGMPLYVTGTRFNNNWSEEINRIVRFLPTSSDVIFLSFICCFIMLLCFKINPWIAGIGAFAYAFNTFSIVSTGAGHIFKILAMAYAPLILGGMALIFRKKYILGFAVTTLAISLEIAAKHYQITYYFAFFGGIYVVYQIIDHIFKNEAKSLIKSLGILFIAAVIGIGPHISRLWSVQEYNQYSTRGKRELTAETENTAEKGLDKDYAFAWSQGKWESFTMLIPHLYAGSSQEGYWGDQPGTAGPVYASSIIFFFFIMYLVNIKRHKNYWVIIGGLFLLGISWGRNFELLNYTLFDYFPLFSSFRSVSMAITFAILALAIGGTIGLNSYFKEEKEERKRVIKLTSIVFFSLMILVFSITYFFVPLDMLPNGESSDRVADIREGLIIGSFFKILFINVLLVILLLLNISGTLKKELSFAGIATLLVFDLLSVNLNYLNYDSFVKGKKNNKIKASAANRAILKDKSHYRVFDLSNPFNNAETSYFHNSIGGYHGAKMRRYQDLIEKHLSKNNLKVLSMLNTKYVIRPDGKGKQVPSRTKLEIGTAWFVNKIHPVNSPDEEIDFLGDDAFDPRTIAVVDQSKFKVAYEGANDNGKIKLDDYKPNHLTYSTNSSKKSIAIFSEIYYDKGWNAYIDGKPVDYFRANYILRGLEIPAGEHKVEFKFKPDSYYKGEKISLIFSIILVLVVLGGFGFEIYSIFKPQVKSN